MTGNGAQGQRASCALFALVTMDLPRSVNSVTSGNAPRFAWATASVASRVGSCPTVCGGRRCGRCPCPTPLPIGSVASISIKGKGCARHPHPFGARRAGSAPRAASGVALDADSSHYTATADNVNGNEKPGSLAGSVLVTAARWPGRHAVAKLIESQPSPVATTLLNLVAVSVTKRQVKD